MIQRRNNYQDNHYLGDAVHGYGISTHNIPKAFLKWFEEICQNSPFVTIEYSRSIIQVVRTRKPVDGLQSIANSAYGKLIRDASGWILEKTYCPKYFPDDDIVRSPSS